MSITVYAYGIRHGAYNDDGSINPLGAKQVTAATRKHLANHAFSAAFHSGINRAEQTIEILLGETGQSDVLTQSDDAFSYRWVEADYLPQHHCDDDQFETARDYLTHWRPAWALMARASEALCKIAQRLACATQENAPKTKDTPIDFCFASHCPVIELAAAFLNPDTSLLEHADILRFKIEVDSNRTFGSARLVQVTHLHCPPIV